MSEKSSQTKLLARRVGRFSFATLISRILGYARDAAVAYTFGGGFLTDSFYTAFRVSNLFRRLLGEGALSSSFIPVFSKSLKTESKEEVQDFFSSFFTILLLILAFLTLVGIIFAPYLIQIIAPGFSDSPDKFGMTVLLTRWTFPFFLFISLAALMSGVLNSLKHFFLPAVAPAMLSVSEIGYVMIFIPVYAFFTKDFTMEQQIVGLSISAVVGGLCHFTVQLPQIYKEKFHLKLKWQWNHPHIIQVMRLMLPALIGLSVDQIDAFVNTICATYLTEGSVTALYNSNRIMQLPLALFGIAIASVSLSTMADHSAENNFEKLSETVNNALRIVIFTILPATVGLIALAHPICAFLFQHGQFTAEAAKLTSKALIGYSIGLVAYSSVKIVANAFYALQEPKTPVRIAMVCILLNVCLNILLMFPLGVGGLALGTSIASFVNAIWLFSLLRKRLKKHGVPPVESAGGKNLIVTLFKTLAASAGMFLYLWGFLKFIHCGVYWQVLGGIAGGMIVFVFLSKILKIEERQSIKQMLGFKENIED